MEIATTRPKRPKGRFGENTDILETVFFSFRKSLRFVRIKDKYTYCRRTISFNAKASIQKTFYKICHIYNTHK